MCATIQRSARWKRFIAREWLYFLGFALASIISSISIPLLFQPDYVQWPGLEPKTELSDFEKYRSLKLTRQFNSDKSLMSTSELQELRNLRLKAESEDSATEEWNKAVQKYSEDERKQDLVQGISEAVLFIPYLLFLFVRTIWWSIRQVRSAPPSGG